MGSKKIRLDLCLVEKNLAGSRERAKALIMAGKVFINDSCIDKPGTKISHEDKISIKASDIPYVSRGGLKLEAALEAFDFDVSGLVCLDVGASTGGFTDCLIQRGAAKVFAVDVGYGQLAWSLRQDPRVVIIERTNIRYIKQSMIQDPVDLAVIDVSFISIKKVIPACIKFLKKGANIIALIKPQFEVGRGKVGKRGVIRDSSIHDQVISDIMNFFCKINIDCKALVPSPILGPKGNKEFLIFGTF